MTKWQKIKRCDLREGVAGNPTASEEMRLREELQAKTGLTRYGKTLLKLSRVERWKRKDTPKT